MSLSSGENEGTLAWAQTEHDLSVDCLVTIFIGEELVSFGDTWVSCG